jgi:glycosyltransferase involved in cell wall biosynthesis
MKEGEKMIAYFVHNLDSYSGAAQQALLLAKHMKRDILFFNHNNKSFKKYKHNEFIEIIDLPQNKLLQLFIILFFTLKYKIEIYHCHGSFNIGLFLGTILRKKMILKTTLLGDDDFDTFASKRSWKVRYFLIKHIYKNIVLSKKLKEINSKYIDSLKIELIPNGVLLAENCPTLEEKENAFCFVGLVCERKKTYESIKYFIENYSHDTTSKMYIVGPYKDISNNHEFSGEHVAKCFDLIKNNNLENRVVFTDRVSKEETQCIFKKSKALLFFSDKEGMPNVVLEAMANNCVPITSEMDGVTREIFEDKKQGFILDGNFEKVDIGLINELIENKVSYLHVRNKFGIDVVSENYTRYYL